MKPSVKVQLQLMSNILVVKPELEANLCEKTKNGYQADKKLTRRQSGIHQTPTTATAKRPKPQTVLTVSPSEVQ